MNAKILCVGLALLFLLVAVLPTTSAADAQESPAAANATAPVMLDGRVLLRVRGVSALPADVRASRISARIAAAAADPSITPDRIKVVEDQHGSEIVAGDRLLLTIINADAEVEEVARPTLAFVNARRIGEAIESYREERSAASIARNIGYALLAFGIAAVAAFVAYRLRRWTLAFVDRRMRRRIEKLEQGSFHLVRAEQVWAALTAIAKAIHFATLLLIAYVLLATVLDSFPWTRTIGQRLFSVLVAPLLEIVSGIGAHLPGIIVLAAIVVIARYVLRWLGTFFDLIGRGAVTFKGFEREWSYPTYRLVRLIVIAFAVVLAYPYIPGSQSAAFQGVSIFLGVLLSLGSSSVIANMIAGYTMTYRRAFRVGDLIKVGDTIGFVTETRLMVTYLRTPKNELVTLPNSLILGAEVLNYSTLAAERGLILHTTVGIGYETPWRQVEAMLLMAADRTAGLLKSPAPFVLQKALADFAVTYELNVCCGDATRMVAQYTELHRNILDVFNEYGVQIMTPAYEGDPEQPKVVAKDQWYLAPAGPAAAPEPAPGSS